MTQRTLPKLLTVPSKTILDANEFFCRELKRNQLFSENTYYSETFACHFLSLSSHTALTLLFNWLMVVSGCANIYFAQPDTYSFKFFLFLISFSCKYKNMLRHFWHHHRIFYSTATEGMLYSRCPVRLFNGCCSCWHISEQMEETHSVLGRAWVTDSPKRF